MRPRRVALALLLLLAGTGAAAAQDSRLAARLDPPTRDSVESLVQATRGEGLPVEPLIQKALEGASKGAGGPRIVAAVRALAGHLKEARAALGPQSTEAELVAGAAALRAGVSPGSLRELRGARSTREVAVPLGVLADMVAGGVAPDEAYRSVIRLARAGADDADFVRLERP